MMFAVKPELRFGPELVTEGHIVLTVAHVGVDVVDEHISDTLVGDAWSHRSSGCKHHPVGLCP